MKSLGKQDVVIESFVNGAFVAASTERLTVYQKADGTFWINNMGSKKQASRRPGGEFHFASHVSEIKRQSIDDILGKLSNASRIVVLPDSH